MNVYCKINTLVCPALIYMYNTMCCCCHLVFFFYVLSSVSYQWPETISCMLDIKADSDFGIAMPCVMQTLFLRCTSNVWNDESYSLSCFGVFALLLVKCYCWIFLWILWKHLRKRTTHVAIQIGPLSDPQKHPVGVEVAATHRWPLNCQWLNSTEFIWLPLSQLVGTDEAFQKAWIELIFLLQKLLPV